jgi:DNA-binding transcriptional ArsR family regulator
MKSVIWSILNARTKYFTHIIQWMIGGTRGGLNRARLIDALHESPQNAHQLSQELDLDYSTIRHHLDALEKNGLITPLGDAYGKMYFLSDPMLDNYGFFEEIWEKIGNKKKKRDEEKMIDE